MTMIGACCGSSAGLYSQAAHESPRELKWIS